MDYRSVTVGKIPKLSRIKSPEDVLTIEFADGIAEVEVPIELLDSVPLKHFERQNSPRLRTLVESIRRNGYSSLEPIICRVGALGNWVVIDGGHRITAARSVSQEVFTNLFQRKVGDLTFILFQTPMSYSKLKPRIEISDDGPDKRHAGIPLERTPPKSTKSKKSKSKPKSKSKRAKKKH
ncbi:MAG: ParB N-terminal domain-containing protein [Filomicrobium sp.]